MCNKEMRNKKCAIKYLKTIFKLHQTIGQKLQKAFFLIFTESKPIKLTLDLN